MKEFLKTWKGKLALLLVFYIPFPGAIFFNFFDGKSYESPIGGCCIPMEGVVIAGYGLFTIWVLASIFLIYFTHKLCKEFMMWRILLHILIVALGAFFFVYGRYDDSPGAQLLGVLVVIGSILVAVKNRKKNSL